MSHPLFEAFPSIHSNLSRTFLSWHSDLVKLLVLLLEAVIKGLQCWRLTERESDSITRDSSAYKIAKGNSWRILKRGSWRFLHYLRHKQILQKIFVNLEIEKFLKNFSLVSIYFRLCWIAGFLTPMIYQSNIINLFWFHMKESLQFYLEASIYCILNLLLDYLRRRYNEIKKNYIYTIQITSHVLENVFFLSIFKNINEMLYVI